MAGLIGMLGNGLQSYQQGDGFLNGMYNATPVGQAQSTYDSIVNSPQWQSVMSGLGQQQQAQKPDTNVAQATPVAIDNTNEKPQHSQGILGLLGMLGGMI